MINFTFDHYIVLLVYYKLFCAHSLKSIKFDGIDDGFHGEIQLPNTLTGGGLECPLDYRWYLVYTDYSGIVPSSM